MRRAPLLPIALALMAGIASQHCLPTLPAQAWWWLTAAAAIVAASLLFLARRLSVYLPVAAMMLCTLGIGGTMADAEQRANNWTQLAPRAESTSHRTPRSSLTLRLVSTPVPRERSYMADAELLSIDGRRTGGDIKVFFKNEPASGRLRYGDRLSLRARLDADRRMLYTTADHYTITSRDSTSLRARSEALRMRLLQRMRRGPLDPREAAVAEALALGWRADIDTVTKASFHDAGIAHLLSVSGLHVGLVAVILRLLCFAIPRDGRGRIARGTVRLAGVWLFALLTGMAPATMRAALMFSLFIAGDIVGRRTPKLNLLAAAAIITLMARPSLLFNVGWQLSYAAVAGILVAQPVIKLCRNIFWQGATVSVSATLATLPVTLTVFHRIYPYFLIANVAIIPLSGVTLGLALAYMAVPCQLTATLLHLPLALTMWLTRLVASLPHAAVEPATVAPWLVAAITALAITLLRLPSHLFRHN